MTPRRLDPQTVRARLRLLRDAIDDLDRQGEIDADRLREDRDVRRIVERCIEHLVDVAAAINAHVAAAELGRAPHDLAESFDLAGQAGMLPDGLVAELRPSAGMRNVIVHAYLDLDFELVAAAVPRAVDAYTRYVETVARFVRQRGRDGP